MNRVVPLFLLSLVLAVVGWLIATITIRGAEARCAIEPTTLPTGEVAP